MLCYSGILDMPFIVRIIMLANASCRCYQRQFNATTVSSSRGILNNRIACHLRQENSNYRAMPSSLPVVASSLIRMNY